ncbi:hypothetical protein IVB34_42265 [Bradyrhizobium sp. 2]|uniref:hypothetical protein n=1 Tax=unclassified Bradyrhizobium TaxID=2631580 RepID=UPI001FFB9917|nr:MULTISPECIES: hypothetical protein [unclassified Bradyrhizobium]MCK1447024.1 hypothetical protein [Bradyrhizobium sp. 48]MCK1464806.1 hypothetical protein [Bradyrhizobium sp. 2]
MRKAHLLGVIHLFDIRGNRSGGLRLADCASRSRKADPPYELRVSTHLALQQRLIHNRTQR